MARLDHDLAIVSGIAAFRLFRGSELWPGDADGETTEALVLLQRNQERINSQLGTFEATTVALEARWVAAAPPRQLQTPHGVQMRFGIRGCMRCTC